MTIDEIIKELSEEKSKGTGHRFPCRAIMVNTIAEYNYLCERMAGICDCVVTTDMICKGDDIVPDYSCIIDALTNELKDQWILLPGVSEYLRLFQSYEETGDLDGKFCSLWNKILDDNQSKARVLIPMINCTNIWERLHLSSDLRKKELVFQVGEVPDVQVNIDVKVFPRAMEETVFSMEDITSAVALNMKDWLDIWMNLDNPVDPDRTDFVFITKLYRQVEPCQGVLNVKVIDSAFSFVKEMALDGTGLKKEWVTEEAAQLMVNKVCTGRSVKESILEQFNMKVFDGTALMSKWNTLSDAEKKLLVVWEHISGDKNYLNYCVTHCDDINKLPETLQLAIFRVRQSHPEWVAEAVALSNAMGTPKTEEYFNALDAFSAWDEQLAFVSDKSFEERKYIIHLMKKVINKYDISCEKLGEKLKSIYPALAAYLTCNDMPSTALSEYFAHYRRNKLANIIPDNAEAMIETVKLDTLPYRYSKISPYHDEDAFVIWVDAMGAEWQSMLLTFLKNELDDVTIQDGITTQAVLPSETMFNDQWATMGLNYVKLNGLDKLAHNGCIDDKAYEACIAQQLSFMGQVVKEAKARIAKHQIVIITGDHGTSRPAALAFHKDEYAHTAPKYAKVTAHGRFCKVQDNTAPHTESELLKKVGDEYYLVYSNYSHYSVSGNAAGYNDEETATYGELHGGATPEEALVPVIVIKNNKTVVPLAGHIAETTISRKASKASFVITFNKTISTVEATVNNINVICSKIGDGHEWKLTWENAQKGKYDVEVTADSCLVKNLPQLNIVAAGMDEDDLFGGM